jgi:hypothetical protein
MLLSDYFNNIADYNHDPEWNFNDMTLVEYFGHVYGGQCQNSIGALIMFCIASEIPGVFPFEKETDYEFYISKHMTSLSRNYNL